MDKEMRKRTLEDIAFIILCIVVDIVILFVLQDMRGAEDSRMLRGLETMTYALKGVELGGCLRVFWRIYKSAKQ